MPRSARTAAMAVLALALHLTLLTGPGVGAELSCVMPVHGAPPGRVSVLRELAGGGALIGAERGWLHFDAASGQVVAAGGAQTGRVFELRELAGGSALIGAERGWFRFDAASGQVVAAGRAETGQFFNILELAGGGVLIGTEGGLFRFDATSGQVVAAGGAQTGPVYVLRELAGGGVLIGTEGGLFRFDAASGQVVAAGGAQTGPVFEVLELAGGGVLIGAERGLFRFDGSPGLVVAAGGAQTGGLFELLELAGGGALIGAERGWFRFDGASGQVVAAGRAETGQVFYILELAGGGVLIGAERGLFRFDTASGQVVASGGAQTGPVYELRELARGDALIRAEGGLFRFDAASGQMVASGGAQTGRVFEMFELAGGGVLIRAERGLFRLDATSGQVVAAGRAETGQVFEMLELAGGGVLIGAERGLFRFDTASGQVVASGGAQTGGVFELRELADGDVLIRAERGLSRFIVDRPVPPDAMRPQDPPQLDRSQPGEDRISLTLALWHPCAPVADRLGLTLVARHADRAEQVSPVQLAAASSPAPDTALIEGDAPFVFDRAGDWTLTLHQGATALAEPLHFRVAAPSFSARIAEAWKWIAGGFAALYAVAFVALLAATRRSAAAFRMLNDAVWAKWLTWPFFFLRHVPAVQRWVLEPWFQEVRRTARRDVPHLDPPLTEAEGGATAEASGLLPRLRDTPRLWLQGRSGMGKSSVFAAWERSYFSAEDGASLSRAARRFGFILVMLPVRHYAALPPPEPNRPESWVIEAVRRRFEMFGLGELDHATVQAMLKAGHIALALDGMNEADCDDALGAFARQFPQVRLLVTSQTRQEGWQLWQLPPDVAQLRRGLLALWLGAEKGAVLDRRIVAQGLGDAILSGYDLRLIADLVGADPAQAPLPADRIALYRAMLARATDAAGEPMRLEGLKALAWTIVTERRREIADADAARLGDAVLKALTREGVRILRQVGRLHEFRHDQMRAFLAALWLAEELPSVAAMEEAMAKASAFSLPRRDQEEVWRFLAALIATEDDVKALWSFANEKPAERGLLLAALQDEADRRDITLVRAARRRKRAETEAAGG